MSSQNARLWRIVREQAAQIADLKAQLSEQRISVLERRFDVLEQRQIDPAGVCATWPTIPVTNLRSLVEVLETAYRNNKEAVEVATTVRNMIPGEVLTAIRERWQLGGRLGFDWFDRFLTNVAKLDGTSPLASQAGRNWTRRLGEALVGERATILEDAELGEYADGAGLCSGIFKGGF